MSGLVYSTELGRTCPTCRQAVAQCTCSAVARPVGDGVVRLRVERKGRGGKQVTVVTGIPLQDSALLPLAKQWRQACGSGGTVKDGVVEIQGDHAERLLPLLQEQGWTVKRTGG